MVFCVVYMLVGSRLVEGEVIKDMIGIVER